MIDPSHKWCTYISRHPKGFYYIGKGLTKAVLAGTYKGSGTSLLAAWEFGGLPKHEWTAEVTATFAEEPLVKVKNQWKDPGELKAYAHEKTLITFEMLCDPFCLNDVPGGKGGFKWGRVSKRAVAKRKKSVKEAMARPEVKKRQSEGLKRALNTPESKEKRKRAVAAAWQRRLAAPEFQEKALKKQQELTARKERQLERQRQVEAKKQQRLAEREAARLLRHQLIEQQKVHTAKVQAEKYAALKKRRQEAFADKVAARRSLKQPKVYKVGEDTRKKMAERQLSHPRILCITCNESFRPACYARYHGEKCKGPKPVKTPAPTSRTCENCLGIFTPANYGRWHGPNCKEKKCS